MRTSISLIGSHWDTFSGGWLREVMQWGGDGQFGKVDG